MTYISANELKKKGVSVIDDLIKDQEEVIITVRGKGKYVVVDMETYNRFREYELEAALADARRELETGNYIKEDVEDHIKRITKG
ncbi:MAG: type II toxin-antitoxin system Phd/YefM family antitoxin [bacterium]